MIFGLGKSKFDIRNDGWESEYCIQSWLRHKILTFDTLCGNIKVVDYPNLANDLMERKKPSTAEQIERDRFKQDDWQDD